VVEPSLIMETTFGQALYRSPQPRRCLRRVIDFCRAALAQEETPVLMSYSGRARSCFAAWRTRALPVVGA